MWCTSRCRRWATSDSYQSVVNGLSTPPSPQVNQICGMAHFSPHETQHPDHLTKLFYEAGLASSPDRALKVRLYHWKHASLTMLIVLRPCSCMPRWSTRVTGGRYHGERRVAMMKVAVDNEEPSDNRSTPPTCCASTATSTLASTGSSAFTCRNAVGSRPTRASITVCLPSTSLEPINIQTIC